MSYDYRTGLLPSGAFATERQQIAAYPYPITVDYTSSARPNLHFWIAGTGDMRAIPKSLVAAAFTSEYSFSASLVTGVGSASWSGTFERGIYRNTDGIETGTALTSQRQAFSRLLIPPETEETEFLSSLTKYEYFSDPDEGPNDAIRIWIDPEEVTYSVVRNEWTIYSFMDCGYDNGEGDGGTASSSNTGFAIAGDLLFFGEPWTMTGTAGVISLSGSITPASWLS